MALHRESSNGHLHAAAHPHEHAPKSFGFAFAFGTALNVAFVIVEAIFGFLGNSTALLADAGHNLSDICGLLVAWGASVLSRRTPTTRYTYGLGSSSILAALFNAMFLLTAVGAIAWEAAQRLAHPVPVAGTTVMIVAAVGIAINGATAWLFASGRKGDINIRGAFLHMAADAAVSAGVVVAGAIILLTGWDWVDPAMSLLICIVIVWGTWSLLKDSVRMSLAAVPPNVEPAEVRSYLGQLPGVAQLHDLHIWPMSTTETALTCHLVMPGGHPGDEFLMDAARELQHRFSIGHATIQIETSEATQCVLEPDKVV
ncbi:MAG TPA: cation diffusion facilitator family transporter [Xanthobacteraceae bacterium]|nr:cation diffusion facilitator family transporter [Xanthobacteraceae bacterium]